MKSILCFAFVFLALADPEQPSTENNIEPQEELNKRLAACWLMSVRDLSANQEAVGRVINSTSETVNNRTQVYYKIQMDIIGRCFTIIELDDALSVLNSLNDATQKGPGVLDIVTGFSYSKYLEEGFNFALDELDHQLLRLVKSLEKELMNFKKSKDAKDELAKKLNEQKRQEAVKGWREALEKQTAERVINPQKSETPVYRYEQPSTIQYIIFAVIMGSLFIGAFFALKKIKSIDDSKKKVKSQKKKKN